MNRTHVIVELTQTADGRAFEAVALALASAGLRCYLEERDDSGTVVYRCREVYPAQTAAQVDACFRAILAGEER